MPTTGARIASKATSAAHKVALAFLLLLRASIEDARDTVLRVQPVGLLPSVGVSLGLACGGLSRVIDEAFEAKLAVGSHSHR